MRADTVDSHSDAAAMLGEPRLVLGGSFGGEPEELSRLRLHAFRDAGGTFAETATSYFGGQGIAALGRWLARNRGALDVVVKVGHDQAGRDMPLAAAAVHRELAEALAALHMETAGVAMLYCDDPDRPVAEIAETLAALVDRGLTRSVGVSNWGAARLAELAPLLLARGHVPLASYHHSLAAPDQARFRGSSRAADDAVLAVVRRHELPLLSWSANAWGYFGRADEQERGSEHDPFDTPASRRRRERCAALGERLGTDSASVALAWLLSQDRTWASIGPGSPARVGQAFAAAALRLTRTDADWLQAA